MNLRFYLALFLPLSLMWGQQDIPLSLNLPTTQYVKSNWAILFTHRFADPVIGNSKNLFGLDGYASSGFGFWGSPTNIPELNFGIYRTSDQKTIVLTAQGVLYSEMALRSSLRFEYFKEGARENSSTINIHEGISGWIYQLPIEYLSGSWTLGFVPTYITQTSTGQSIFNIPLSLKYKLPNNQGFIIEFYPIPNSLRDYRVPTSTSIERSLRSGFAFGYEFRSYGHRFTLFGTNTPGTTAHQVISGNFLGVGARVSNDWGLAFNIVRLF